MKKLTLFLLLAFFAGVTQSFATKYCGETITGSNGHQATVTFRSLGNNQYEFVFESVDAFTSYNAAGSNFYTAVNGVDGTQVSNNFVQDGKKLTFTTTSNPAPNFYVGDFYVNYSNGECKYTIPIDEEWSDCTSSTTHETTPASCTLNGNGKGTYSSISYSAKFENDDKGKVTLTFTTSQALSGVNGPLFYDDENQSKSATTTDNKVFTLSLSGKNDGNVVKLRAYFPMFGGVYETELMSYTVGMSCGEEEGGDEESQCPEFTASSDPNNNASEGADGRLDTRWWSKNDDGNDVYWEHTYPTPQTFNRVKIVWEGAYGKSYEIYAGDDCEHLKKIAEVSNLNLSKFPHTQISELEETITAKTIRFQGIEKATGYGYSFWELEVYEQQEQVLTTLEFSASADICKKGDYITLTATPKDQYGVVMTGQTINYTVSPSTAGHVADGKYYADAFGQATITATCGTRNKQISVFNYEGENLALSTNLSTDNKIDSHSNEGQDGYVVGSAKDAFFAVDNNDGSLWEGKMGGETGGDEVSRTYDSWFIVDLGALYDINLVMIKFEGACSQNYTLDFSTDKTEWKNGYTYAGNAGVNGHTDLIYEGSTLNLQNNSSVRYVRFWSTKAATQYNMKIYYFKVFGTEAATSTKKVSATVNNSQMGSATVKQNNVEVTEVEVGTDVVFSAEANDGYVFIGWYQGDNKVSAAAVYTVENIQSNTTLQARFRATNTIYCHTALKSGDHTIFLTMKRIAANTYQAVIDCEEAMRGFTNAYIGKINGENQIQLNNAEVMADHVVLSADKHRLTVTVESTTPIRWNTPVYVDISGEVTFADPQNKEIEYDVPCEDVALESVAFPEPTATVYLEKTLTLVPVVTPWNATNQSFTWTSSNTAAAEVNNNGVVTAVAVGETTITATSVANPSISAQCVVTVSVDNTVPQTAAPIVDATGKEIRAIYSDDVDLAVAHSFGFAPWGNAPVSWEKVANNNYILADASTTGDAIAIGFNDNGESAIIAKTGYSDPNDADNKGIYAFGMKYLHVDIWSKVATNNFTITVNDYALAAQSITGEGWQSLDIDISAESETDLKNIRWMKYTNLPSGAKVAIDNVYFWKSTGTAAVESVSLNTSAITLDAGDQETLVATVSPIAANQNVTWETSNEAIATVANGVVTAVAEGEAIITAKSKADPTKLANCTITVNTPTDKIWYGNAEKNGVLFEYKLTYKTDKHVVVETKIYTTKSGLNDYSFSIDGEWKNMAQDGDVWTRTTDKIFEKGAEVECYFRVAYEAGGVSDPHFNYVVGSENTKPIVTVTGVQINKSELVLAINETETLTATVLPMNADNKNISWSSDNTDVATVDASTGLVTAIAAGKANITATSEEGNKTATCELTVAAELTPATFYFNGASQADILTIRAAITRNVDRTLTYEVKAYHEQSAFSVQINDGEWHDAVAQDGIYTYQTSNTYVDGQVINGFFYTPFYGGGAGRVNFSYTVGSENEYTNPMLNIQQDADNEAMLTLYNNQEVDVTLSRSFEADGANYTLCLPFSMTADQCLAAFGDGYKLFLMGTPYMKTTDVMYLPFSEVTAIEAGKPYLFCPAFNVENPTIEGVTINAAAPQVIGNNSLATMTGIYSPYELPKENNYVLGEDNWLYQSDGGQMYGLRCYFTLTPSAAPAGVRARAVFHNTDVVTDLETVDGSQCTMHDGKYVINGQFVIIRNNVRYNGIGQQVK